MRYQICNGTVSAGGQTILSHIDFEIKGKEKIAIVGRNGAGKTTLLRLIAGGLSLDRDDKRQSPGIVTDQKLTIGMLRQDYSGEGSKTVEELLLEGCPASDRFSRDRFLYEMEYDRLFTGFGFALADKRRTLASFSGGEQTKIALIRELLAKPDILLLDEPTNHLDIRTVEWLEDYMAEYDRAVIFVSHDRFFLDQVVDVVYELSDGRLKRYAGNYTAYRTQKIKDLELQKKAYERQQAEIAHLNELIEKFKHKPNKAAFARSRRTMLERMERVEAPKEDEAHLFTGAMDPLVMGSKWVVEAEHLKLGYDRVLLELSLRVRRGQKIGIIGANGAGKSTFLKTIAGYLEPLGGMLSIGNHTVMGYFDQHSGAISSDKPVAEHFHELFPALTEKEVRQTLGAYLFGGSAAAKRVDDLSGGEKARLVLAEILTGRPNLLLLDEPTNHMDIPAKETLESAFRAYTGTMLFVSHDRYFIEQVADAILVFEEDHVLYYPFGYAHYIERLRRADGRDLAAMILAEDQALIADLRAVPKEERHRLREINTEEAYADWRLRLAAEPLQKARDRVETLWNQYWMTLDGELEEQLEDALKSWTDCCMEWYEIWEES